MQESKTTIDELVGEPCDELLGITGSATPNAVIFAMLRSGSRWFRFTIDVGVLFFDASEGPTASGDVGAEDHLLVLLRGPGPVEIASIRFRAGVLEIAFVGGGQVRFTEDAETSMLEVSRHP